MSNNHLVIGSNSTIGKGIISMLLEEENQLFSVSRNPSAALSEKVNHLSLDDGTETSFPDTFLPDEVHGLVYGPGTIMLKPFRTIKPEQFETDFRIHVLAAVKSIQWAQKKLAAEFAPRTRVNAIAPSLTDTPLAERLINSPENHRPTFRYGGHGIFSVFHAIGMDHRTNLAC